MEETEETEVGVPALEFCPLCGRELIERKGDIVCVSLLCRGRVIEDCC